MTVQLVFVEPRVELVFDDEDVSLASGVDADTVLGVIPGSVGLELLAADDEGDVAALVFPVADDVLVIKGSADATKTSRFEVDGHTASSLRVHALADADGKITQSSAALTDARLPKGTSVAGVIADSNIQDGVASGVLTIAKDGTTARVATFPDAAISVAGQNFDNLFSAGQSIINAAGLNVRVAATQDGVALVGRAGGTSSYLSSITPATLTGNRTVTLPDASLTVAGQDYSNVFSANQRINASLGIGTAPSYPLHVYSAAASDVTAAVRTASTTNGSVVRAQSGDGTTSARYSQFIAESLETVPQAWSWGLVGSKNWTLYDGTAGQTRITVDTAGNVGISITPSAGNGLVQLPQTTTTKAGAVGWGDVYLYRVNTGVVRVDADSGTACAFNVTANSLGITLRSRVDSTTGFATVGTTTSHSLSLQTSSADRVVIDTSGNTAIGTGALATTATNGFPYIPTCAGTPTGTPTAKTGMVPLIYDSTNNKLYAYNGAWKSVTLT